MRNGSSAPLSALWSLILKKSSCCKQLLSSSYYYYADLSCLAGETFDPITHDRIHELFTDEDRTKKKKAGLEEIRIQVTLYISIPCYHFALHRASHFSRTALLHPSLSSSIFLSLFFLFLEQTCFAVSKKLLTRAKAILEKEQGKRDFRMFGVKLLSKSSFSLSLYSPSFFSFCFSFSRVQGNDDKQRCVWENFQEREIGIFKFSRIRFGSTDWK